MNDTVEHFFEELIKNTGLNLCQKIETFLDELGELSEAHSRFLMALERLGLSKPDLAKLILKCLEKCIHKFQPYQAIPEFYITLTQANIARSKGDFEHALQDYRRAKDQIQNRLPFFVAPQRVRVLEGMAEVYRLTREFEKAAVCYQELIQFDQQRDNAYNLVEDYCDLANMQLEIALNWKDWRSFSKVETSLQQAEFYLTRCNQAQKKKLQASIWGMRGKLELVQLNLEKALTWFEKALKNFSAAEAKMREGRTQVFIGKVNQQLHRRIEANEAYADAFDLLEKYGYKKEVIETETASRIIGDGRKKDQRILEQELQKSIQYKSVEDEVGVRIQLGKYLIDRGDFESALEYFETSFQLAKKYHLFFDQVIAQLEIAKLLRRQQKIDEAIRELEICLQNVHSHSTIELKEFEAKCEGQLIRCRLEAGRIAFRQAVKLFKTLIDRLENLSTHYQRENLRIGFFESLFEIYQSFIQCYLKYEPQNKEILAIMENARGKSLNLHIISGSSYLLDSKVLFKEIDNVTGLMTTDTSIAVIELFELEDKLMLIEIKLNQSHPEIHTHTVPVSQYQALKELLMTQFSGTTTEYLQKLKQNNEKIFQLAQANLQIFFDLIRSYHEQNYSHIYIIPHREWHHFPFEAFYLAELDPDIMPNTFLVRCPNLRVLTHLAKKYRQMDMSGKIVALDAGHDLYLGSVERFRLKELFKNKVIELIAAGSKSIRIPDIESTVENCSIFHISSHADFAPHFPMNSHIELGRSQGDQKWTMEEMLKTLRFKKSPLVVMSACDSGRIQIDKGDEYFGFGRAFLSAGAATVISANWKIHEIPTTLLFDYFYQNIKTFLEQGNFYPAQALAMAIQKLRQMDRLAIDRYFVEKLAQVEMNSEDRNQFEIRKHELLDFYPDKQTFNSPEFWSGFTCTGISAI